MRWVRGRGRGNLSVHPLALGDVAGGAAGLALHRGGGLALALLGRLLVELALAGLGQDAGLLAGALEAAEGKLEGLVFADFDAGHLGARLRVLPGRQGEAAYGNGSPLARATAGSYSASRPPATRPAWRCTTPPGPVPTAC